MRTEVVRMYVECGASTNAIAKRFGYCQKWVWLELDAAGVKRRPRGQPRCVDSAETRADVVRRYERGESLEAIANAHLRPLTWARQVLVAEGVTRRPRGRPRKAVMQAAQAAA